MKHNVQYEEIYKEARRLRRPGSAVVVSAPKGKQRSSVMRAVSATLRSRFERSEFPFTCSLSVRGRNDEPLHSSEFRIIRD